MIKIHLRQDTYREVNKARIIQRRMTETHYEGKKGLWTCKHRTMWNSNLDSVIGGHEIKEMKC